MKSCAAFALAGIVAVSGLVLYDVAAPYDAFAVSVGDAETPERFDEDYTEHNCLDISSWNGDITDDKWEAIKDAGVDSVIIRAGYSKLNTGRIMEDECFETNIKRASEAGMDIGVYYFTVALSPAEAEREAKRFVEMIRPYRSMITLPAVLDYETNSGGRLNSRTVAELGPENCTKICDTFMQIVKEAGFTPMLYASRGLLDGALDAAELEDKYLIWIAQYTSDLSATGYEGDYYIWQYSSSVRIPGVSGRFDGNYLYEKKYTALENFKDITADPDSKTRTYTLSADVSSQVPAKSKGDTVSATVRDSEGSTHEYTVYKS